MIIQISAIWCSSCLVMQKTWDIMKQRFPDIKWSHYDLDFDASEVSKYQVKDRLPVLIFLDQGIEKSRLVGEKSLEEVSEWINQNING